MVGSLVLILAIGFMAAALWLSVGYNKKEYTYYTVYLSESVAGLNSESAVKYNGVQVGIVKKIALNQNDPRQVELTLSIEAGTPITTSTTATLISQGITGIAYVGLSTGSSDLTPLQKMQGEPYPVIPAKPSLFNQLDSIIKQASEDVSKISIQAQKIFNEENALHIKHFLTNLDTVSTTIADSSGSIAQAIKNTDKLMIKLSRDFPQISKDIRSASKEATQVMISGKNALNQVSSQTLPSLDVLLKRLNSISANLDKVSNEMRQNPSVLVRGAKPPKNGPGE
jgi:phospholipid/cholesterol/gamma-HCH transport system substrate-binding protein